MARKMIALAAAFSLMMTSCTSMRGLKNSRVNRVPKNVIFMIVDGMGFEYVKATRIYNGQKPLAFEKFPCASEVTTCAADGADQNGICLKKSPHITDSAAGATAMATGVKVANGVVSKNIVHQQTDIETILEISKRQGKSTGVVATKLFTDATPAAFIAHADGRGETDEILHDIFQGSLPNLVFGADTPAHRLAAKNALIPYTMVHTVDDLKSLAVQISNSKSCDADDCPYIYGGFGQYDLIPGIFKVKTGLPLEITPKEKFAELKVPHLSEMTEAALTILSKNKNGFFLMVESSMTDTVGHHNKHIDATKESPSAISVLVKEMVEMEHTAKVLENFVHNNPDTLVVLTADHETGGLVVEEDKTACLGRPDCIPTVRWTSPNYDEKPNSMARHTGVNVPLYAIGQGAEKFCKPQLNNTDIKTLALSEYYR